MKRATAATCSPVGSPADSPALPLGLSLSSQALVITDSSFYFSKSVTPKGFSLGLVLFSVRSIYPFAQGNSPLPSLVQMFTTEKLSHCGETVSSALRVSKPRATP